MPPSKKELLGKPQDPHDMYPEAIDRDGRGPYDIEVWDVSNGWPPAINSKERKMRTPLVDYTCPCGANHARALRLQQYGHLGFTPDNADEQARAYGLEVVQSKYRRIAEETRVLQLMRHHVADDFDHPVCIPTLEGQFLRNLASQDVGGMIQTMLVANQTPDGRKVVEKFGANIKRQMPLLFPFIAYVQDSIDTYIGKAGQKGAYEDTLDLCYSLESAEESMTEMMEAMAELAAEEEAADVTEQEMAIKDWGHRIPEELDGCRWANMRIEVAPLNMKAAVKPTRKWTMRDEGVIPKGIHRWSVDGRIFAQPVHKDHGYAVLIDCSGSMSWSPKDLEAILEKAPATTVALYSASGNSGILRIVSKGGKRAQDSFIRPPDGGGNGIDGPALRWLAKQKGLKIWLSDGHVTGISDGGSRTLFEDASAVVKKGRIMQTFDAEETIKVVRGEAPWRWKPARQKGM